MDTPNTDAPTRTHASPDPPPFNATIELTDTAGRPYVIHYTDRHTITTRDGTTRTAYLTPSGNIVVHSSFADYEGDIDLISVLEGPEDLFKALGYDTDTMAFYGRNDLDPTIVIA